MTLRFCARLRFNDNVLSSESSSLELITILVARGLDKVDVADVDADDNVEEDEDDANDDAEDDAEDDDAEKEDDELTAHSSSEKP